MDCIELRKSASMLHVCCFCLPFLPQARHSFCGFFSFLGQNPESRMQNPESRIHVMPLREFHFKVQIFAAWPVA